MKKQIVVLSCALAAATAFCDAAKSAPKQPDRTSPEYLAGLKELRLRQHGGLIELASKGSLAILNAQKQFAESDIAGSVSRLQGFVRGLKIDFKPVDGFSVATAKTVREKSGAAACVYLVDDATLPMSLIALEEGWGVVNIAPLKEGNPDEKKLKARFVKEFVRVSSVVFSGAKSQYRTSPLQSVTSVADLDKTVGDSYGMDTVMAITENLPGIGVTCSKLITYREACQRGIAPQPTNEFQKAIWNQVHEIPSEPITIKK